MYKFYCNGKKGFCDTYDGEVTSNCYDCIHHDESGGEVVEIITQFDLIKSMNVKEMAELFTTLLHEESMKVATRLKENNIDFRLVELDHDLQVAIHQRWLESEVTE